MTGSGMTQTDEKARSNLNTPSTSATSPEQEKAGQVAKKQRPLEIQSTAGDLN